MLKEQRWGKNFLGNIYFVWKYRTWKNCIIMITIQNTNFYFSRKKNLI